jgi:predicted phosphodiesterase
MRLAIPSDIHGNPLALDAVLADIQSQGEMDSYWVLGDFSALGYDPVTLLETITALPHARFTRGNADRYVVTGDLPVQPEKAREDPALLPQADRGGKKLLLDQGLPQRCGLAGLAHERASRSSFDLT